MGLFPRAKLRIVAMDAAAGNCAHGVQRGKQKPARRSCRAARLESIRQSCAADTAGAWRRYFAPAAAYFLRNLSTRPAVSTIFCLPV